MTRIPEPDRTPQGPAYEGRLLDRPDEEVVDQGAAFDIGTLLTRRRVLSLVGIGLGTATLAACAPAASGGATSSSTPAGTPSASTPTATGGATVTVPDAEIPDETAGPYPGDGSNGPDVLERSGVVRSDIRSSIDGGATAEGVPLTFSLTILDMASGDVPFQNVAVYAWHCDAQGRYSMYSDGVTDQTYLRGVQVAGVDGTVTFTSIFPGCYSGRWPHIHFEVYPDADAITDASNAIATSQIALPQSDCEAVYADSAYDGSAQNLSRITLASDNVFGNDQGALQLATTSGSVATGYTAAMTVRVDTGTAPAAGGAPGGGRRP
ncbi:intradiol ring-cleavage dioxygenase [Microbacterium sp.]|uniref:intradiol ring-cleavage dioxygenase n=1 Tax=Microbacterium sp. TaxID=51671 RepID=UPI003A89B568